MVSLECFLCIRADRRAKGIASCLASSASDELDAVSLDGGSISDVVLWDSIVVGRTGHSPVPIRTNSQLERSLSLSSNSLVLHLDR